MYVTAQRVRSGSEEGINVFRYLHRELSEALWESGFPDLQMILSQAPGYLVDYSTDIAPGGNNVLSCLDVVAPDGGNVEGIRRAIERLEGFVQSANKQDAWYMNQAPVALGFRVTPGVVGKSAREQLIALCQRLMTHLKTPPPLATEPPVVVRLSRKDDTFALSLEPAEAERLHARGAYPMPGSLTACSDILDAVDKQGPPGPFIGHMVAALTGQDLHQLVVGGGVRVVDGEQTIWERLPARV